jgi:hypothetical protein
MNVNYLRIRALLESSGFMPRGTGRPANRWPFVRADNHSPGLFQQIDVDFSGRQREAVGAYVTASTSQWIRVKGLCVARPLCEVATDKERCWSIPTTEDEAKQWEELLALVGPLKASELVAEEGGALLDRTAEARRLAERTLARLDPERAVPEQITALERVMPPSLVAEARRLAAWPGVLQLRDAEPIYMLACLSILNRDVARSVVGSDRVVNDELMWQIQLVADGILSWRGNRRGWIQQWEMRHRDADDSGSGHEQR